MEDGGGDFRIRDKPATRLVLDWTGLCCCLVKSVVMVLPLDELFEGLDRQPLVPDDVFHLFHLRGVELRRGGSGLRAGNLRQTVQLLDVLRPEVHVLLGVALWWIVGRPREGKNQKKILTFLMHS